MKFSNNINYIFNYKEILFEIESYATDFDSFYRISHINCQNSIMFLYQSSHKNVQEAYYNSIIEFSLGGEASDGDGQANI